MVRFTMNLAPGNLDDLEPSVKLAKELGARAFAASPIMPFGRGASFNWKDFTREQLRKFEDEFEILSRKHRGFFLTIPESIRRKLTTQHCGAGHRTFAIGPTGEVRPCVNVSERLLNFGNITLMDLKEIFSHPAIERLKRLQAPGPATCLGCQLEAFCQLCWYRGLVSSQYIERCAWLESTDLPNYTDMSMVRDIASSCNLKYQHSFREL